MADLGKMHEQLSEVEAGLEADPSNPALLSLRDKLKELIALGSELVGPSSGAKQAHSANAEHISTGMAAAEGWKVGDECEAVWSGDGNYYKAVVEGFTPDGVEAKVLFTDYQERDQVNVTSLRRTTGGAPVTVGEIKDVQAEAMATKAAQSKKALKKKLMEKREKWENKRSAKEREEQEVAESAKSKWQNFAAKSAKKKGGLGSGKHGQSIFATPDNPDAKVGVGTCGIGGKNMTKVVIRGKEKWQAGGAEGASDEED